MTRANNQTATLLLAGTLAAFSIGCGSTLPAHQTGTGGGTAGAGTGTAGTSAGGAGGATVGTAGAAGAGTGTGGTAGGSAGAVCGTHLGFGTQLYVGTEGPRGGVYDGPATIERSTREELVVAFQPSGMTLPMHVSLQRYDRTPMPMLPLGAQVWLSKNPAGSPVDQPFYYPPPSWSIAVRDQQNGRLLLGAVYNPTDAIPSPVPISSAADSCTTDDPDWCNRYGTRTYSAVDVHGDTTVSIADSQTGTVAIGGIDYDVRVSAQLVRAGTQGGGCADWQAIGGIAIDAWATDLAGLAAALPTGPLPACAQGNDDSKHVSLSLYEVRNNTPYDGPVFYSGRSPDRSNCFLFDVVGLTSVTGSPPQFEVCAAPDVFSEPAAQQEFWATLPTYSVGALRGPQRGPLLVAFATTGVPIPASDAAQIEQTFGVAVGSQRRCDYAALDNAGSVRPLWDLVFAATPQVTAPSETITSVQIAGTAHRAWYNGARIEIF